MTEFSFETFCKDNALPKATIQILEKEHFVEKDLLIRLEYGYITGLDIPSGEKVRLSIALEKLRKAEAPLDAGAVHGARVKLEPVITPPGKENAETVPPASSGQGLGVGGDQASGGGPRFGIEFPTTTSLAQNAQVKALLEQFLATAGQVLGFRDLLSLSDIQASSTPASSAKGERNDKKPLLIKDFLWSSINCNFSQENDQEIQLSGTTKIVVEGRNKKKKPDVTDYTTEQWCSANHRIILHLLNSKVSNEVLTQYVEYSSWIGDYLEIFKSSNVFELDEQHRLRVAFEGRPWNNLYSHDVTKFLHTKKNAPDPVVNQSVSSVSSVNPSSKSV